MRADKEKLVALIVILAVLIIANWGWLKTQFNEARSVYIRPPQSSVEPVAVTPQAEDATFVKRVVDGDTIELSSGQKVRYIGVNTPESVDPRKPVECFGKEAAVYNKSLVEGKTVKLVKDVTETDKYGRLLRYVYLKDGTFVNEKLVLDGYATAMTIPPDVVYAKKFAGLEAEARTAGRGLWSKCR